MQTPLDGTRGKTIIRIQKNEEFPFAFTNACIASCGQPLILLPDAADPRVTQSHVAGIIWRPVINDDNFKMRVTLREDTFDRIR
jgi:hypothetical protein